MGGVSGQVHGVTHEVCHGILSFIGLFRFARLLNAQLFGSLFLLYGLSGWCGFRMVYIGRDRVLIYPLSFGDAWAEIPLAKLPKHFIGGTPYKVVSSTLTTAHGKSCC